MQIKRVCFRKGPLASYLYVLKQIKLSLALATNGNISGGQPSLGLQPAALSSADKGRGHRADAEGACRPNAKGGMAITWIC